MPLKDAQFLESRQFHIPEIARWFGIPPHKLRDLTRATYSNITEQKLEWYEDLLPWLMLLEQECNAKLFTDSERAELFVQHIVEQFLKGDIEKRAQMYATGLQWGWLNRNEVRRKENLNSLGPAGDVYMVPTNMIAAEDLGRSSGKNGQSQDPDQDSQPEPNREDQDSDSEADRNKLLATAKRGFRDALERMLHKEAREASKAAQKPDDFLRWLDPFYGQSWPQKLHRGILPAADICRAMGLRIDARKLALDHARRSKRRLLELSGNVKPQGLPAAIQDEMRDYKQLAKEITDDAFAQAKQRRARERLD